MKFEAFGYVKNSFRHIKKGWAIATTTLAIIGDVVKPLANFAPYLLLVSALGFAILFLISRNKLKTEGVEKTFNSTLGAVLSFFALSTLAWLVFSILFLFTPPKGVASSTIPGVSEFQQKILKIGEDVTEIKSTTTRIEQKIDALSKNATLISNPKTPEEFYHNARFYELKGNTGEAEKAYEKFLELAPDYLDAHQAYQILMNNTQGIEATKNIYASLEMKYPQSPIVALMSIRLIADRNERIQKLKQLSIQYPKVGPIFYELSQEYLRPGPGNITIEEMKFAKESFAQFKKSDSEGLVKPFYLDKNVLEEVYKKRDEYDKMVNAFYGSMIDRPIEINVEVLPNSLVSVSIIPRERNIQRIFYSIDNPNPTIDTGVSPYLKDPMTGQPMPNYQVSGKSGMGKHMVYAKYVNSQGKESQVFSQPFEVAPISARLMVLPTGDLGSEKKNIQVNFSSIDGKNYQFFYSLHQPHPDKPVSGSTLKLEGMSGPQELYYYGVAGGVKTSVYNLKLSQ